MSDHSMLALPQLLRFLSTHPAPNDVAHALVRGPLARYAARTSALWIAHADRELRLIGASGLTASARARYSIIPLTLDMPLTLAFRQGVTEAQPVATLIGIYPALSFYADYVLDDGPGATTTVFVHVPIRSAGRSIGVWGFRANDDRPLDERDTSFIDGIAAALGMWLSHPATQVVEAPWADEVDEVPLALSPRQAAILRLVLEGLANPAIAERLRFSQSTVKHELQRAMRSMRAGDRTVAAERAWELGLLDDASGAGT